MDTKNEDLKNSFPKYCSSCGEKLEGECRYCGKCGAEIKIKKNQREQILHFLNTDVREKSLGDMVQAIKQNGLKYPKGLLKVFGIFVGIIYAYCALGYLHYFNYYYLSDKLWGLGMMTAYIWNALLLFVIALRCRKEYGRSLAYALFGGIILASVLQAARLQNLSQYYTREFSDYYPFIGGGVTALLCWYFMKKESLLLSAEEDCPFWENIRKIPKTLSLVLFKNVSGNSEKKGKKEEKAERKETKNEEGEKYNVSIGVDTLGDEEEKDEEEEPTSLGPTQIKIWRIGKSRIYLVFCLIYTINMVYPLFGEISFITILFRIFPLLFCIGFWQIYFTCRKNKLDREGFALIEGLIDTKLFLYIMAALIVGFLLASLKFGIGGFILPLLFLFPVILYWNSLRRTVSHMTEISKGVGVPVFVSWYPIFVLIFRILLEGVIIIVISYIQNATNNTINMINQYFDAINSSVGILFSIFGLDYGYGYESSYQVLQPITEWIQSTFGFGGQQGIIGMLLTITMWILEVILLFHLRSSRK